MSPDEVNPPGRRRARLLVAYDGAQFHGFAANDGVATVMGSLADAVGRIVRSTPDDLGLVGAGRTDAGVHAWGQVVSCALPAETDLGDLAYRVNRMLGPSIAVRAADWVPDDFHARFSATARHYRYLVWNAQHPNPLLADRSWHVPAPLARWALDAACDPLLGEHDFSSFCRRPKVEDGEPEPTLVRRVIDARWSNVDEHLLRFEISANAFCQQMVRSIVGTLVDVGRGKLTPGEIRSIIAAHDRSAAGTVAPPHGLTLWQVDYPDASEEASR